MATAGHILVKDVRRLRLPIALWLAVVVVRGWLVGSAIGSAPGDLGAGALIEVVETVLPLLEIVFVCVLVVLAVQQDPLVGTDAFWLTRPIARRALLASKLEFVALVVVLPQVVREMAVMAANGVTARHMLLAFPEVVLHDLLV